MRPILASLWFSILVVATLTSLSSGFCTLALPAYAESSTLLEQIRTHLQPTAPFRSSFQEKRYIAVLTAPLESRGEIECMPGEGIVWKTNSPVAKTSIITPRGVSIIERSQSPRTLSDQAGISRALLSLMSGDVAQASESFSIAASGSPTHWTITLTPRDSLVAEILEKIVVSGGSRPESIEITHANSDRIVQTFSAPTPLTLVETSQVQAALHEVS